MYAIFLFPTIYATVSWNIILHYKEYLSADIIQDFDTLQLPWYYKVFELKLKGKTQISEIDSRLITIHFELKTSSILIDSEWNINISEKCPSYSVFSDNPSTDTLSEPYTYNLPAPPEPPAGTYLNLEGVGLITVEEQNVFCSNSCKTSRLYKSRGSAPLVAPCHVFVAVKSKETPEMNILTTKPLQSKANPLDPISSILIIGEPPIHRIIVSDDCAIIFVQTTVNSVHAFQRTIKEWEITQTFRLESDEVMTFTGCTLGQALLIGTSRTRLLQWNPMTNAVDLDLKPNGDAWTGHSITSACVPPSLKFAAAALTNRTVLLLSLPSGTVRKILSFSSAWTNSPKNHLQGLSCTDYFCTGFYGSQIFVWEVWNGCSSPRSMVSVEVEICGLVERKCRLIAGTMDGGIHVWSLLTGQKLNLVKPLGEMGHKMVRFHVVTLDTAIMTFITGVFMVKFEKQTSEDMDKATLPVTLQMKGKTQEPDVGFSWRDRIVKLLNETAKVKDLKTDSVPVAKQISRKNLGTFGVKKPPFMKPMPFEEAKALGTKGAAETLKMGKRERGLPTTNAASPSRTPENVEANELTKHKESLVAQMSMLQQHNVLGAARQKLIYDKDADVKKSTPVPRQPRIWLPENVPNECIILPLSLFLNENLIFFLYYFLRCLNWRTNSPSCEEKAEER